MITLQHARDEGNINEFVDELFIVPAKRLNRTEWYNLIFVDFLENGRLSDYLIT